MPGRCPSIRIQERRKSTFFLHSLHLFEEGCQLEKASLPVRALSAWEKNLTLSAFSRRVLQKGLACLVCLKPLNMKRQSPVYIIGHRNPDTDSICSAICYAHLKAELGMDDVIPARAGKLNKESIFALNYFKAAPPLLLTDVYPRVADVTTDCMLTIRETQNLRELAALMRNDGVKSIPVVNEENDLKGIITVSDMAKRYFEDLGMQSFIDSTVSLREIAHAIDAETVVEGLLERELDGNVRIAAGSLQTVQNTVKAGDIILVGDRIAELMLACIRNGASCLIVTGSGHIPPEVIQAARERKTAVLSCPHDTYTCARLINQCVPVSQIMQTEVVRFKPTDMLSDIKGVMEKHKHRYYPVEENGKLVGMVSSEGVMVPEKTKVILVDHNERSQAIEGVEKARILEIVDHHRLGGIQTNEPIFTRQDPVGCTCTIIADMHIHRQVAIPPQIAGLMLSAIISDTVLFKSPTCTEHDKEVAHYLAKIAGIDIEEYGMEMLKAGTDIDNMSADEIVKNDMKEFLISHYRISISQCSVMDRRQAEGRKDEILAAAEEMRKREGYDLSIIMITNIMEEASILIFSGEPKSLVGDAFKVDTSARMVTLPGVMSRKKQVVPPLSEAAKLISV